MGVPDYVAQTCDIENTATLEARRAWVSARASEAKAQGCTWPRHCWNAFLIVPQESGDPVKTECLLFEAWVDRPQDMGLPGWHFASAGGVGALAYLDGVL